MKDNLEIVRILRRVRLYKALVIVERGRHANFQRLIEELLTVLKELRCERDHLRFFAAHLESRRNRSYRDALNRSPHPNDSSYEVSTSAIRHGFQANADLAPLIFQTHAIHAHKTKALEPLESRLDALNVERSLCCIRLAWLSSMRGREERLLCRMHEEYFESERSK